VKSVGTAPAKTTTTATSAKPASVNPAPVNSSTKPGAVQTDKYIEERKKQESQEAKAILEAKNK
jgi:hypothetical protein